MGATEGSGASRAANWFNEDAFLVEDELGLYVVCDGASGGPAGERAARIAVDELERFVAEAEADPLGAEAPLDLAGQALRHAVDAVVAAADADPELAGMSTTISMLLVLGSRGVIGHTGDSRVYRIRRRRLTQLTSDHDHAESLSSRPATRAGSELLIDSFAVDLAVDDVFVLCTDGAEEVLGEPDIARAALDASPQVLASRIASRAHRERPDVDATVVVVHVRELAGATSLSLSARPTRASFGHMLATGVPRGLLEADDETVSEAIESSQEPAPRRASAPTRRHPPAPGNDASPGGDRSRSRRTRS